MKKASCRSEFGGRFLLLKGWIGCIVGAMREMALLPVCIFVQQGPLRVWRLRLRLLRLLSIPAPHQSLIRWAGTLQKCFRRFFVLDK
jgi:hypothetical protein